MLLQNGATHGHAAASNGAAGSSSADVSVVQTAKAAAEVVDLD